MIAPAMTPPAMPPCWSLLSVVDGSVAGVGVGVGTGVELDVEDEVVLVLYDDVEAADVSLIGTGAAVAMAPIPPKTNPGRIYDDTAVQRMARVGKWQRHTGATLVSAFAAWK